MIKWAVNCDNVWPTLWNTKPSLFWYFYPARDTSRTEFEEKWMPWMPGDQKCPYTGWRVEKKLNVVHSVYFNSGVTLQFKTYEQRAINLQASTLWAIFIDEEPPYGLFHELLARRRATDGYISIVFTPTIGQPEFAAAFDKDYKGTKKETFPDAYKRQISLYECKWYTDKNGKQIERAWTDERIQQEVNLYIGNYKELMVRIYGYFIKEGGLMYGSYDPKTSNVTGFTFPLDWNYYVAVDIGSGGKHNHPAAIVLWLFRDYNQGCFQEGEIRLTSNA